MAIFSFAELQGYVFEAAGLAVLYYWFILQRKFSDGMNYCVNAIGFICIAGISWYELAYNDWSQNLVMLRIDDKLNSAHFATYFPVMVMAFYVSVKYRSSVYGLLTAVSFVAIHETIFTAIFMAQRLLTGSQWNDLIFWAFLPSNFMFACVLLVWAKYVSRDVVNKVFWAGWIVYTGAIAGWAFAGFPVTIDAFYGLTTGYGNFYLNLLEDSTWWLPLAAAFWSLHKANEWSSFGRNLRQAPYMARELYHELRRVKLK